MKKVAVVILNWNGRALLERYLPAVTANTNADVADVYVADNGSSDDSLSFIRQHFPTVKIIELGQNYGFAGGYNRAITPIPCQYIVLLNSDVAPAPGWIEPLVALMDAKMNVAACAPKILDDKDHSRFEYAGAAGGFIDRFGYPYCRGRIFDTVEQDDGQYDMTISVGWVSGAAMMIRKSAYEANGGLDETFFAHMEEIDLCWRLLNKGWRIVSSCKSTVYHYGGATLDSSDPQKTYLNFRNNLLMIAKNYNGSLLGILTIRLLLDGVAAARFLLQGKTQFVGAIAKAHRHFFARVISIRMNREVPEAGKSGQIASPLRPLSIVYQYFIRGRKTFSQLP